MSIWKSQEPVHIQRNSDETNASKWRRNTTIMTWRQQRRNLVLTLYLNNITLLVQHYHHLFTGFMLWWITLYHKLKIAWLRTDLTRRELPNHIPSWNNAWWRQQMETFSALLALCAGNSPDIGEFPSQRPVTRSFDVIFDLRLNKWLSKQWEHRWFVTPSRSLWRHCIVTHLLQK